MSWVLVALLLAGTPEQGPSDWPDTVVVCPQAFQEALGPWIDYRQRQGHRIAIVSNLGTTDQIRRRIREVDRAGQLRFVVLVGEAGGRNVGTRCVPMHYAQARVNVLWGSEPTLSTDNWYAQPEEATDEEPRPELAVGRLAVASPDELRLVVAKILAYERSTDFGPWRQQLNFVAGMGGFGALADAALESAAGYFLTQSIPADFHVSMTYGSWQSPYCPDPRRFRQTAVERLDEGTLFWVYIGHGYNLGLDYVYAPRGRHYPILDLPDVDALHCSHGRPIALFMSCYAGAIDARQGCLAEAMLRAPGGPVAVLAGTRVTMPYAMTVMATSLTDDIFVKHCPTLGEAILHAKQAMLRGPAAGDRRRAMLDMIAAAVSPAPAQLAAERAEHVLMFNLIGDPLLRLRHPLPIALAGPEKVAAGESIRLSGRCPVDGHGTLELVVRRNRLLVERPDRAEYPTSDAGFAAIQETYGRANQRRLSTVDVEVRDGLFTARLDVPRQAIGACHACMFVEGVDDFASGAIDIHVLAADKVR